ncbi:MAG: class I SAM-dependent methyltransferase [Acidimicrobiales bacterium]
MATGGPSTVTRSRSRTWPNASPQSPSPTARSSRRRSGALVISDGGRHVEAGKASRSAMGAVHAVRARLAEDVALAGLTAGLDQYVLLGAGLDTFAWRHPRASEFVIWEVDHPDTQSWKRAALRRSRLSTPPNVHFISADLSKSGVLDLSLPERATWNWMGVTMYLERFQTEATLRAIASGEAGTTLVANFLLPPDALDALGQAVRTTSTVTLRAAHEPVVASYSTDQVATLLRDAGFSRISLLDADALSERYLRGRTDLRLPRSTVIALATV